MAQITVVGSKCWIVMASCPRGLKAKNGCYCQIRSAVWGRRRKLGGVKRRIISLVGDQLSSPAIQAIQVGLLSRRPIGD